MPLPLPSQPETGRESRSPLTRLIDAYNPGITLLVMVWVVGLASRNYLQHRGELTDTAYKLLTSLIYVVPIMLVGWAVLAVSDRVFNLGLFPRDDE